jgi:hypothetical protein
MIGAEAAHDTVAITVRMINRQYAQKFILSRGCARDEGSDAKKDDT